MGYEWAKDLTRYGLVMARRHRLLGLWLVFMTVWLAASFWFYARFPNNLTYPNFYAEDGSILGANILHHGFGKAFTTTFNGYYIWGLYLLEGAGVVLNAAWHNGQLVDLPKAFAVVSYGFWGLAAALPIVLLRPYLAVGWRLLVTLAITLVPLPASEYAILGTIGNLKFLFVPIALMLVLYRVSLSRTNRWIIAVDLGLLICLYTNVTTYLLLLALLLGDGIRPRQLLHWRGVVRRDNVALWSGLVLGLVACYQLFVVATHGIPPTPGYLDTPLQQQTLVEVGIGRSYLFPLLQSFYKAASDPAVIVTFAILLGLGVRYAGRQHRWPLILAIGTVAAMTGLFVATRPGVTGLFKDYSSSGPDQFFYAQNIIFMIAFIMLLADITLKIRLEWRPVLPALLIVVLVGPGLWMSPVYAKHDFMQHNIGTIKANAQKACQRPGDTVSVALYPVEGFFLTMPRGQVCTGEVMRYQPDEVSFGLNPEPGSLEILNAHTVQQTFVSPRDGLNGVAVYLATYMQSHISSYQLRLMDEGCIKTLRMTMLSQIVEDNAYLPVRFAPIGQSRDKRYCFEIEPVGHRPSTLAARLTAAGAYPDGRLIVDRHEESQDLVFTLLYPNQN